jgi:hypothetical protein
MITLGIVVAVGYLLLFALCRKSAQADQVTESWAAPATLQVAVRPVPQTAPVGQPLPRAG